MLYEGKLELRSQHTSYFLIEVATKAGFTYRLGRLKPRASQSRGPLAKVSNILTLS